MFCANCLFSAHFPGQEINAIKEKSVKSALEVAAIFVHLVTSYRSRIFVVCVSCGAKIVKLDCERYLQMWHAQVSCLPPLNHIFSVWCVSESCRNWLCVFFICSVGSGPSAVSESSEAALQETQ